MATQITHAHRLPGLDGLRAVSIVLVIAFHLHLSGPLTSVGWINSAVAQGGIGVEIFFTVSGLLITWLLLREEAAHGSISLRQFYARRAVRILPPARAYLFVILIASVLHGSMKWDAWVGAALFYRNLVRCNPFALGFVDTGHYWSLSVEEQFYFVWPLLIFLLKPRARVQFLLAAFLAVPWWRQLNYHHFLARNVNEARGDLHCDGILAGCLLACAIEDIRCRRILSHPFFRSDWVAIACVMGIVATFTTRAQALPGYVTFSYTSIRAMCVAFIVHRVIRREERKDSILDLGLNLGVVAFIGQLSYSLYLWQQPFCMPNGIFRPTSRALGGLAAFACAIASYFLIERPAQRIRRNLGSRTTPILSDVAPVAV